MKNLFFLIVLLALAISNVSKGSAVIDTYSQWDGHTGYGYLFGESGGPYFAIATYGQTFQAPTGNTLLTGFNVWMSDLNPENFAMYVMAWTNDGAIGPALYTSPAMSLSGGYAWQEVSFSNMNVSLQPNQSYIFVISASKFYGSGEGQAYFAGMPEDTYSGGDLYTLNNGTDTSQWTNQDWNVGGGGWDLVFQAQFDQVPEPSSLALIGVGMLLGSTAVLFRKGKFSQRLV